MGQTHTHTHTQPSSEKAVIDVEMRQTKKENDSSRRAMTTKIVG